MISARVILSWLVQAIAAARASLGADDPHGPELLQRVLQKPPGNVLRLGDLIPFYGTLCRPDLNQRPDRIVGFGCDLHVGHSC